MKTECVICGQYDDCYDLSDLTLILNTNDNLFVCSDCLKGIEFIIDEAKRKRIEHVV